MVYVNLFYYHHFFDILLRKDVQQKIFIYINTVSIRNEDIHYFDVLYSKKYENDSTSSEYIYVIKLDTDILLLLYEDQNCKSEIFIYFKIINNKLKLYNYCIDYNLSDTLSNDDNVIEFYNGFYKLDEYSSPLDDLNDNFYISLLLMKSGAYLFLDSIILNNNYNSWLNFWKDILNCKYINVIQGILQNNIFKNIPIDLINIIFTYLGIEYINYIYI
jgi:hypothetical protein